MKKFNLNKIASDGNYYAIEEILVKPECVEQVRKPLEENYSTFTWPLAFDFFWGVEDKVARKKLDLNSPEVAAAKLVESIRVEQGNVIARLHHGLRTVFVSTVKCSDENLASYIIRAGEKKDALVCPWCIKEGRQAYRDCIQLGPFWLCHTIYTVIETKKGTRFLYVYRCKYDNKLFIVERPDSRFLESEFHDRCPYCEAGKDRYMKMLPYEENIMYFCTTCRSVFSVGGHPKDNVWENFSNNEITNGFRWDLHEKVLYDNRSLDPDYY